MKKEVIMFRKSIPANTVAGTMLLTERIKDNGVIEEIRVRFYSGSEGVLKLQPYVNHKVKAREDFFTYNAGANQYLSGDDDYFVLPIHLPVEYDDDLIISVWNESTLYAYTLSVDVIISYDGEAY